MERKNKHNYTFFKIVGNNIKEVRINKHLTIKQLSEISGINEKYIVKIEKGEAVKMSATHLFKLADALEINACCLVI